MQQPPAGYIVSVTPAKKAGIDVPNTWRLSVSGPGCHIYEPEFAARNLEEAREAGIGIAVDAAARHIANLGKGDVVV